MRAALSAGASAWAGVVPTSVLALAPGYRPVEAAAAYVGGAGK
ncbi:MAG TPA: hypothetical protein QF572_00025 [Vicinamibacterales bacterium]|nr:hypothetical protein [Vicinamibacterales bacterium]